MTVLRQIHFHLGSRKLPVNIRRSLLCFALVRRRRFFGIIRLIRRIGLILLFVLRWRRVLCRIFILRRLFVFRWFRRRWWWWWSSIFLSHPVRQDKTGSPFHIGRQQIVSRRQRGNRPSSFQQKQFGPMPGRIGLGAVLRRQLHHRRVNRYLAQQFTSRQTTLFQQPCFFSVLSGKTGSIAFPGQNPPHHLDSCRGIRFPLNSRKQTETVQNRRRQYAFFRVHRTDQRKPNLMLMGNPFPFDGIDAPIRYF